ncbi:hypothetical protein AB3S75_041651 [Citrus x aurantiifolia]
MLINQSSSSYAEEISPIALIIQNRDGGSEQIKPMLYWNLPLGGSGTIRQLACEFDYFYDCVFPFSRDSNP